METTQIDRLAVIAIAVIAYAAANITHEIIGHCGMALVMGTKCTVISSTYIPLETFPPTWKYNIIVVAGCGANFAVGLVCLAMLRKAEIRGQRSEVRDQTAEDSRKAADRGQRSEVGDQTADDSRQEENRGQRSEVRDQTAEDSRQEEDRGQRSEVGDQTADGSRQAASLAPSPRLKTEIRNQTSEVRTEEKPPEESAVKPAHSKEHGRSQEAKDESRESGVRRRGIAQPTTRYLLWLLMAVNLFLASTYIMAAPIIKFGDSYILIHDLPGQIFWRPAVALAGAIAWWFSFRVCRFQLARLIGAKGHEARAIAWQLVTPAYLTGGILWVASALFSPLDWKIAQLEAAGGTFGLTIWLLLLPFFLPQIETPGREPLIIPRSPGWIIAGALTAVIFVGVLGRGFGV